MKKILAKVKDHTPLSHHSSHASRSSQDDNGSDGLRASLYEDTTSQAPPTLGTTPIKGNVHDPTHPHPPPPPLQSSSPPRPQPASVNPLQQPVNFSRLPVNRADGPSSVAAPRPSENSTAAAIRPQDLASPEYSYLSKVYGKSSNEPTNPLRSHAEPEDASLAGQNIPRKQIGTTATTTAPAPAMNPMTERGPAPALPPRAMVPDENVRPSGGTRRPNDAASVSSSSSSDYSRDEAGPLETPRRGFEPDHALPKLTSPNQPLVVEGAPAKPPLEGIVNLTNTVDTDVTVKQAPAVVHETIIPEVLNIREEKIEREIHTYDVFHRIQPIIDVEVLPPRHFIPVEGGGLREVSADDLPGQTGHWGIVETVTKEPPVAQRPPPPPAAPEKISEKTYVTEDGILRTETTWKHPPTLATGAKDTGQSWPLEISQREFEERDGVLGVNLPMSQTGLQATGAAVHASPAGGKLASSVRQPSAAAPVPQPHAQNFVAPVSPTPAPQAPPIPSSSVAAAGPEPPLTAAPPRYAADDKLVPPKRIVPGSFPSASSTATLQSPPPLPPR